MAITRRGFLAGAGAVAVVATLPKVADAEQSVNTILARVTQSVEIDGTGATNVSAELNAFLNGLPPGSEVILPAGARFRCDQTIIINGRSDLTIVGNGAVIFTDDPTGDGTTLDAPSRAARTRAHVRILSCTGVTVRGLVVRGAHPGGGVSQDAYVSELEAQHGFDITGSSNVLIQDCAVTDVYGDFVYASWASSGVSLVRLFGRRNGRQGVAITSATGVLLEDCDLADVRRALVDLEPLYSTSVVSDVVIRRCTFGAKRLKWIACGGRGRVDDVLIEDCVINAPANLAVDSTDGVRRARWTLLGNRSTVSHGTPLGMVWEFTDVDGVTAHGNSIRCQPGRDMYLVGVSNCTGVDVSGNEFPGGVGEVKEI